MIRLTSDALARILHNSLYVRMVDFCRQYTPEVPAGPIVDEWLRRLYAGDTSIHILVNLDGHYNILEHAVIDVQEMVRGRIVVWYQTYRDKGNITTLEEGIEYLDKLAEQVQAHCIIFFVEKHSRAFEKKYGYRTARTVMIKVVGDGSVESGT